MVCIRLFPLLHSVYEATNITCQVLDSNCYDHQNILKRWLLPVKEDIYKCTCQPCFDEPEEMANDIGDAVKRAKATREVIKQTKSGSMYAGSKNFLHSFPLKEIQKGKVSDGKNSRMEKDQFNNNRSKSAVVEKDKAVAHCVMQSRTRSLNIKFNKPNPFQTTYQKDFSLRNPQSTSQTFKHRENNINQKLTPMNTRLDQALVTRDVDSLLEKVTTGTIPKNCSNMKISLSQNREGDKICYVHSEISPPVVHRYVNLKEAMDLYGVPSEIVKLLKTFHQYIRFDRLHSKRKGCGRDSFLHKLNESNQSSWGRAASESIMELCLRYLLVFVDILSKNKTEMRGNLLAELEEEFNFLIRSYNKSLDTHAILSDDVPTKEKLEFTCPQNIPTKWHWAMVGIWNKKSCSMFSDLKNTLKISYDRKEDCILLQKRIQEIQKLHLQVQILEVLHNVFLNLSDLQVDHAALAHLYKTCSALCNISCPSVPVLLKL